MLRRAMKHSTSKSTLSFYTLEDHSVMIVTTKNKSIEFLVDTEDVPRIKCLDWQITSFGLTKRIYARSVISTHPYQYVTLHQLIMSFPLGKVTDHLNRDTLDNRKSNLRSTSPHINSANRSKCKRRHHELLLGVSYAPAGRFKAIAGHNRKNHHLGTFDTQDEAHAAYCSFKKQIGVYL